MKVIYFLAAALLSAYANAQQAPAVQMAGGNAPGAANTEPRTFISGAEIASQIDQTEAAAKAGAQTPVKPLLQSSPFRAVMENHTAAADHFSVHKTSAELMVVLDGSGTLTMGGKLVNPTPDGATSLHGTSAEGAIPHKLVKGDMILVPANTPHGFTQVDGGLVLMTMQVPLPAPAAAAAPATADTEPRTFISAAEIANQISQTEAATKAGTQTPVKPLLQSGPFRAVLEIHTAAADHFSVHKTNAELEVILDGSGTLTTGGTLVNPTPDGTTSLHGTSAEGAIPHKLVKGDMILVPANTPHGFTQVDGKLVLILMPLPLPAPAAAPATALAR